MQLSMESGFSDQALTLVRRAHAPGRINLIGEHTDYNGGKVLPFAMQLGIEFKLWASSQRARWQDVNYEVSSDQQPGILRVSAGELLGFVPLLSGPDRSQDLRPHWPAAISNSWSRYVLGALLWHHERLQKATHLAAMPSLIRIQLNSNLPVGAGVSSSAALCVGLLALLADYAGLTVPLEDIARQAMYIEHQFAGTRCGLMDQTAVALCQAHQLLLIDFKDLTELDRVRTRSVKAHPVFSEYRPVLINTMVSHSLGSSPYNERRQSCEEGFIQLRQATGLSYPSLGYFAEDQKFLAEYVSGGQQAQLLDNLHKRVFQQEPVKARRLAHAIMETLRVDQAAQALEQGDLPSLARLINASHDSLRNDYEVSCFELDLIRQQALDFASELADERDLQAMAIVGARMTGGGFGGSTIQLVHTAILDEFCRRMRAPDTLYAKQTNLVPEIIVADFAEGLSLG